jgi:hypothetical protein
MYLKVSPMRGLQCLKVRGKLTPRFIDPFKIMEEREEAIVGHRTTVGWCDQDATLEHCVPCGFLNHYSWNSRVHT